MRKKKQETGPTGHAQKEASNTQPSAAPVKKTIVKARRSVGGSQCKKTTHKLSDGAVYSAPTQSVDSVVSIEGGVGSNGSARDSGTERSPTPLENGLLQYLTLNINPSQSFSTGGGSLQPDDSWLITSFDISVTEYLQGIVRLVQSDCPEAVHDIKPFLSAMEKAFVDVKALDNLPT